MFSSQAKAQESVSPSETQVLLASEPLFATAMSCILLGEKLGSNGVLGGGLLILAVLLASGVIDALKSKTKTA